MNYTATQMSKILTAKLRKKVTRRNVQKALSELGYTVKIGRKYIPTPKGELYSKKIYEEHFSYFVWEENILAELEMHFW